MLRRKLQNVGSKTQRFIDKKLLDDINRNKHSIAETSEIAAKFTRFKEGDKKFQLDSSVESW